MMIPHTSQSSPVAASALVLADLGNGTALVDLAGALSWGAGLGPNGEGRIHAYRVIEPRTDALGTARRPADASPRA